MLEILLSAPNSPMSQMERVGGPNFYVAGSYEVAAINSFPLKNLCSHFMVVSLTIDKAITCDKGLISTDCESDAPQQPTPPTKTCLHLSVWRLGARFSTHHLHLALLQGCKLTP